MIANHLFGACLPTFGNCADRYCLGGYGGGGTTMEEMLDLAKQVEGLDGLELVGNWHVNDGNIRQVAGMFRDRGLKISMLVPDLWTQAKWGRGSLAAPDAPTRRAAVDEVKKVLDWAAELACPYIDVWPGQDGFDYAFQADYIEAWKWLRDGLVECAEHNDKVRLLVEYKLKEPRTHCFVNSAAKVLLLLAGAEKIGVLLGRRPRHRRRRTRRRGRRPAGPLRQARLPALERQLPLLGRRHDGRLRPPGRLPGAGLLAPPGQLPGLAHPGHLPLPRRRRPRRHGMPRSGWKPSTRPWTGRAWTLSPRSSGRRDACESSKLIRRALGL